MKTPEITSDFALLDVMKGRHKLAKHFKGREGKLGPCPPELRIPVVVVGSLVGRASNDDGVSIEFEIEVDDVTLGEASS